MSDKKNGNVEETTEEVVINADKRKDQWSIDPRKIKLSELNKRDIDIKSPKMQELIAQIRENGVKVALQLKPNPHFGVDGDEHEYIVYAGNRRLTAVMHLINVEGLNIKYVKAEIDKKITKEEELAMQIIENSGEDFTLPEKSEVIRELVEVCQWTPKEAAKKLGLTEATVSNLLTLSRMDKKHKRMLVENTVAPTLAMQILRESDTTEEFTEKMEELFIAGEELKAQGAKTGKRALITAKNAGNVLVKKKVLTVLENVCLKVEEKKLTNEKAELLVKITGLLRKQDKNTEKKILALLEG